MIAGTAALQAVSRQSPGPSEGYRGREGSPSTHFDRSGGGVLYLHDPPPLTLITQGEGAVLPLPDDPPPLTLIAQGEGLYLHYQMIPLHSL